MAKTKASNHQVVASPTSSAGQQSTTATSTTNAFSATLSPFASTSTPYGANSSTSQIQSSMRSPISHDMDMDQSDLNLSRYNNGTYPPQHFTHVDRQPPASPMPSENSMSIYSNSPGNSARNSPYQPSLQVPAFGSVSGTGFGAAGSSLSHQVTSPRRKGIAQGNHRPSSSTPFNPTGTAYHYGHQFLHQTQAFPSASNSVESLNYPSGSNSGIAVIPEEPAANFSLFIGHGMQFDQPNYDGDDGDAFPTARPESQFDYEQNIPDISVIQDGADTDQIREEDTPQFLPVLPPYNPQMLPFKYKNATPSGYAALSVNTLIPGHLSASLTPDTPSNCSAATPEALTGGEEDFEEKAKAPSRRGAKGVKRVRNPVDRKTAAPHEKEYRDGLKSKQVALAFAMKELPERMKPPSFANKDRLFDPKKADIFDGAIHIVQSLPALHAQLESTEKATAELVQVITQRDEYKRLYEEAVRAMDIRYKQVTELASRWATPQTMPP